MHFVTLGDDTAVLSEGLSILPQTWLCLGPRTTQMLSPGWRHYDFVSLQTCPCVLALHVYVRFKVLGQVQETTKSVDAIFSFSRCFYTK